MNEFTTRAYTTNFFWVLLIRIGYIGAYNWAAVKEGLNNSSIQAIAPTKPLTVYIETRGSGVFSVTNMSGMFMFANNFNQNLIDWNVSAVTDMTMMFADAVSFDQDISGWDVSGVAQMGEIFLA